MKGYILNDDPRLSFTEAYLMNKGCILYDSLAGNCHLDFVFLGFNGLNKSLTGINNRYYCKLDEKFFKELPKDTIVYTGKFNQTLYDLSLKYAFCYKCLMQETEIIEKNAVLTAEGLISEIIQKRPYSLENSKILVIGYGHCGKAIANKLVGLSNRVIVCDIHQKACQLAKKDGFEVIEKNEIQNQDIDIIINTAPKNALDTQQLKALSEVYLFDISSFPYGYHHEDAGHLHDYILPGLPSQYGYKEAGKILGEYIFKRGMIC